MGEKASSCFASPLNSNTLPPEEIACPACGGELSALGYDVSEQLELISSALKVIEAQRPKLAYCGCDNIIQAAVPSNLSRKATQVSAYWRA